MFLYEGEEAREVAAEKQPSGAGSSLEDAAGIEKSEVWVTSFRNPGPDGCEFRMFDGEGREVRAATILGY